jgi:hypothetical protein
MLSVAPTTRVTAMPSLGPDPIDFGSGKEVATPVTMINRDRRSYPGTLQKMKSFIVSVAPKTRMMSWPCVTCVLPLPKLR